MPNIHLGNLLTMQLPGFCCQISVGPETYIVEQHPQLFLMLMILQGHWGKCLCFREVLFKLLCAHKSL